MTSRRRGAAVLLTAALLITTGACSGSSDPAETESTPSPSASSSSPEADATTAAVAPPGPVDACDLVDEEDWGGFVPSSVRDVATEVPRLSYGNPAIHECAIVYGGLITAATIGIAIGPVDYGQLHRDAKLATDLGGTLEDVPDLGDRAFLTKESGIAGSTTIVAEQDGDLVRIQLFEPVAQASGGIVLAQRVLDESNGEWRDHPVLLSEDCPAATQPRITAITGPVRFARGGGKGGSAFECDYSGRNGTGVTISVVAISGPNFDTEYDAVASDDHVVDPRPGPVVGWNRFDLDNTYSLYGLYPKVGAEVGVKTLAPPQSSRANGSEDEFLALAQWYLRQLPFTS